MAEDRKKKELVFTKKDSCRMCYTCVRECPAKAIRIANGQAEVINSRCIACGNCTQVCSQGAKLFLQSINEAYQILNSDSKVVALIAPSFVAEFIDIKDYQKVLGMIKALGFYKIIEVAFGADIIAKEYQKYFHSETNSSYIASDCPAIVSYIENFYPELVNNLAPIVSPMVATARIVRKRYGNQTKVIFIGPCIAKKAESNEIDCVLTFIELRKMLAEKGITVLTAKVMEFDPPIARKGSLFPISRGLLETMEIQDSIYDGNIILAEGRTNFQDAIKEFLLGVLDKQHLELLCCEGCIMGPGLTGERIHFARRTAVANYAKNKIKNHDLYEWLKDIEQYEDINLSRSFDETNQNLQRPSEEKIKEVLQTMGKNIPEDHLNCGACGYDSCRNHAIAIINGLAETEMCLPYSIEKLHQFVNELAVSNDKLISVQHALVQSEKLAHMGQLSAGIAHELNNPLGIIIMYSNILLEECSPESQMRQDLKLITEQSERCKKIVSGLLNFARKNHVNYTQTDLPGLVRQSMKSIIIPPGIKYNLINKLNNNNVDLDTEQIIQVLSNLEKNAIEAMPEGGSLNIELIDTENEVNIIVNDSGQGIKPENLNKIFEPFFTTKGIGKGTGLGLATAYGIVKMHKGNIIVTSNADPANKPTGTSFKVSLPRYRYL